MDKADCRTLLGIYGDEAKMRFGFLNVATLLKPNERQKKES